MQRSRQALGFGIALITGCLILIGVMTSRQIQRLVSGEHEFDRTQSLISALETLQGLARDAEIAQRAYLISGDHGDHERFTAVTAELETQVGELAKAVAGDDRRTRQFAIFRGLLFLHHDFLTRVAATRRDRGFGAARQLLMSARDLEPAAQLRAHVNAMLVDARRVAIVHGRQRVGQARQMQGLIVLALVLTSIASAIIALNVRNETNEIKNRILATVSHELRTPLNAIIGWAAALKRGVVKPPEAEHAIEAIERNAKAETALIAELLDLSHIMRGRLMLMQAPTDLRQAVDAAVREVVPLAKASGLTLNYAAPSGELPVLGDAERLQQIASHLLSNAVKFTPSGGRVEVSLAQRNQTAELVVRDTGEGIDLRRLPELFEPFYQGDTRAMRKGLGIGLALVKELVDRHSGTLTVQSEGPGRGSTFIVGLPVLAATEARNAQQPI
jgi:signal transduction histidine kinase